MGNQNNQNNNGGMDGRELPFVIMLLLGAGIYKYGTAIEWWFNNNMIEIVIVGVLVVSLCGYIIVRRMTKKEPEEMKRMSTLSQVKAKNLPVESYYNRRNPNKRGED